MKRFELIENKRPSRRNRRIYESAAYTNEEPSKEEIIGWIADHRQLWEDFTNYFPFYEGYYDDEWAFEESYKRNFRRKYR